MGAATCIELLPRATGAPSKYAGGGMAGRTGRRPGGGRSMEGTWYERLNALDALFLDLEDRTVHMHVGAVALFEGPPPPYPDLLALIEARLPGVPRYRQRVMFVPLKQGRPVWVDE